MKRHDAARHDAARAGQARCAARLGQLRCSLGVGADNHDLRRTTRSSLGLPVLVHQSGGHRWIGDRPSVDLAEVPGFLEPSRLTGTGVTVRESGMRVRTELAGAAVLETVAAQRFPRAIGAHVDGWPHYRA